MPVHGSFDNPALQSIDVHDVLVRT